MEFFKITQIEKLIVYGENWLPSVKSSVLFDKITSKYIDANVSMQFGSADKILTIG